MSKILERAEQKLQLLVSKCSMIKTNACWNHQEFSFKCTVLCAPVFTGGSGPLCESVSVHVCLRAWVFMYKCSILRARAHPYTNTIPFNNDPYVVDYGSYVQHLFPALNAILGRLLALTLKTSQHNMHSTLLFVRPICCSSSCQGLICWAFQCALAWHISIGIRTYWRWLWDMLMLAFGITYKDISQLANTFYYKHT